MSTEQSPETFEWVPARAKCSAEHLFALLMARIESDVTAMQACLKDSTQGLSLHKIAADRVIVAQTDHDGRHPGGGRHVTVTRSHSGIAVDTSDRQGATQPLFEAKVSVGPEGRCRYEVNEQPLELWQVSRKALEDLFFS